MGRRLEFTAFLAVSMVACSHGIEQAPRLHLAEPAGNLDLFAVQLLDGHDGWAVGDVDPGGIDGRIYRISDGGQSWIATRTTTEVLTGIHFVDVNTVDRGACPPHRTDGRRWSHLAGAARGTSQRNAERRLYRGRESGVGSGCAGIDPAHDGRRHRMDRDGDEPQGRSVGHRVCIRDPRVDRRRSRCAHRNHR
jgi:hypothetical protein